MQALHLYSGNLFGGIERLLLTLARERGACPEMTPAFGLCFPGRLASELRAAGVPVHMLGGETPLRLSRPWTIWQARRRLAELLEREKPDAVLCHSYWPHAIFGPVVRKRGIPLAFCAHDLPSGKHWLERWAQRTRPDLVIANSHCTAAAMPELFAGVPCEIHPPAVSPPNWIDRSKTRAELRQTLQIPPETTVILMAARLEPYKGQRILIEALGQLAALPGWTCWIAGGPQRPSERDYFAGLQAFAASEGVGHKVKFLGQRNDVADLLAAADIHCQPNVSPEPFGIAFVEALYAGLPVVSSAIGGAVEIVSPDCGLLTPPRDAAALSAAIRELIQDPQRRRVLGDAGPKRAAELCDPQAALARLHATLAKTVPDRGEKRPRADRRLSLA